ncbi:serine/threonine-protein kinase PINK1, mitochondrial-like isoform X2 [Actinia tenebrosa]|uniref:non-specific serine/threonine protein kinase n=1 Tax=Actinia tenebrosa TaxID=6105 RepID=A0A6P8IRL8_ACTTE|nr:serine/threonine-protein kinase PINK1, mitochondrial-like isoform X2 [Actinia tenebrosa]
MSLFRLGKVVIRSVFRRFEVLREVPYSKANQVPLHSQQTKAVAHYGQHSGLVSAPNTTRSSFLTSSLTRAAYQGFVQGRSSLITNYGSIFKGNAIFRLMRRGGIQGPLFAFLGFVCSADLNVKTNECREEEEDFQRLYQWMQHGLRSSQKEKSITSQQDHKNLQLSDYKITDRLGKPSSNSAVYKANRNNEKLAVKMLFNFCSSKTYDLTRKFSKEQEVLSICNKEGEEQSEDSSYIRATPHFNILPVLHSFLDSVPCLPDAKESYPASLPSRHDPSGIGRNRTMFTVMPRMDCTVEEYIASHTLYTRTSTLLLLQLLNGISHLCSLGIAHRDLKTDNLLLDISTLGCPRLLICDFDCCLAEKRLGMKLPFVTQETDRGGNLALMAPEVVTAQPGNGVVIDYSKADAWAAGAIAYELFGSPNPFGLERLDSSLYKETDLPRLKKTKWLRRA